MISPREADFTSIYPVTYTEYGKEQQTVTVGSEVRTHFKSTLDFLFETKTTTK